jgi:hypothetical protein
MLPSIAIVDSVEMIRDGGSLAAIFRGPDGSEWWLFMQVVLTDRPTGERGRVGYSEPVATHRLKGIAHPVSWEQASVLLQQMRPFLHAESDLRWLDAMERVASTRGALPPQVPPNFQKPFRLGNPP